MVKEVNVMLVIWTACALLFAGIGVYDLHAKKQVGFWSNFKEPEMRDVPGYNRAVGRLFLGFAAVFELIGILIARAGDSPLTFLLVFAVPAEVIGMILLYLRIERKYK